MDPPFFALLTEPMFLNIMIMQRALQREQSEVMNMRSRSADFKKGSAML